MLLDGTGIPVRSRNEIFVFIDLGGSVWFFLFVSNLCIFNSGRLSAEKVWPWRMDCDCVGNYRVSYQSQHSASMSAVYAKRN